jgi:uncharacterized protein
MSLDPDLVRLLACPETKADLVVASPEQIEMINAAIARGELLTRDRVTVGESVDAALFREGDDSVVYPVRDGIPVLLIEEQICVQGLFKV